MGVVIVSGYPAAGKSTLTRRLAEALGFVVVCRDRLVVDSGLRDVQGELPEERRGMIPSATDKLVSHLINAVLDAGQGVVVDNNFNWKEQREPVRALVESRRPPTAEICLWADAAVLRDRYIQRGDPPWGDHLAQVFERAVSRPREPVMGPPVPVFQFDTTDLSTLDDVYPTLLESVREAVVEPMR